jgi:RNA polymerase sigma-70 factor (family 1)
MTDPLPFTPDQDLVARIRAGDESAFQEIFLQHYKRLCVIAARMTGSDGAAEELVQDVLFRVWQQRERWDVSSTIGGYLTVAVRNHALNRINRERLERGWRDRVREQPNPGAALHGSLPTPGDELASSELAAAISRAIDDLPPRCREAYVLRRYHGLSYAEIARVMGTAPKTVEIQIGKALKALQWKLADWL